MTMQQVKNINKTDKHIHNHLLDNDILTASQSGFIKRDSAVNPLINITNDFGKAITYTQKKCLADNRTAKYEASVEPAPFGPTNFKNSEDDMTDRQPFCNIIVDWWD
jgi:hypothetical protein